MRDDVARLIGIARHVARHDEMDPANSILFDHLANALTRAYRDASEADVERVAEALFIKRYFPAPLSWATQPEATKEYEREHARAAIQAWKEG